MIIRNRKTNKEYEITEADWAKLNERKMHTLFAIVSTDVKNKISAKNIPIIIQEFQQNLKINHTGEALVEKKSTPKKSNKTKTP